MIGIVISQGPVGKDLPIAFATRTIYSAVTKYYIVRELLVIVQGENKAALISLADSSVSSLIIAPSTWLFCMKAWKGK